MRTTIFKRWHLNTKSYLDILQTHSIEVLPRIQINTHFDSIKPREITISWLFWGVYYFTDNNNLLNWKNCAIKNNRL